MMLATDVVDIDEEMYRAGLRVDENQAPPVVAVLLPQAFHQTFDIARNRNRHTGIIGGAYSLYSYGADGLFGTSDDQGIGAWTFGATHTVTLDVTKNKCGEHPFPKKETCGFDAVGTIKRSEFGMSEGVPMVGDDVKIQITVEGSVEGAANQ